MAVGAGRELQGLHHAADDDENQRPEGQPGLLHQSDGHEVRGVAKVCTVIDLYTVLFWLAVQLTR